MWLTWCRSKPMKLLFFSKGSTCKSAAEMSWPVSLDRVSVCWALTPKHFTLSGFDFDANSSQTTWKNIRQSDCSMTFFHHILQPQLRVNLNINTERDLRQTTTLKVKMVTMNAYVSTIWMIIDCKCSLYMRASWSVLHKRCCKSSYVLWCRNSFSWLIFSGRKTSLTWQHQLEYLMVHSFLHPVLWLCFSEATLVCASCPYLF